MNNFKKTILLGGAALCLYPAALFAETCGTTPSCSSLGFTVPAASLSTSCKDKSYLKCPFGDYYFCSASTACTVANCAKCADGSTTKCETCEDGYHILNSYLANGGGSVTECIPNLQVCTAANCKTCESGSTTKCAVCDTGYALSALGTCQQLKTCNVSGCLTCVSGNANKCSVCKLGYELTSTGLCQATLNTGGCNGVTRTCNGSTYCCPTGAKTPCDSGYNTGAMCFMFAKESDDDQLATDW